MELGMKFYHYIMLMLIKLMNGRRGRDVIIGILRGSKGKKIKYFLEKKDLWAFYNLFGFSSRADLIKIFEELLDEKLIEIREEMLGDGWYPLVYITSEGRRCLKQYREDFGLKLDELLAVNKRLREFQVSLLEKGPIKEKLGTLEKIRLQYPRAYEKWTDEEDTRLKVEHDKGLSARLLSEMFQRQPSAIRSRLRKLGIVG
jgi:hypothetical protein